MARASERKRRQVSRERDVADASLKATKQNPSATATTEMGASSDATPGYWPAYGVALLAFLIAAPGLGNTFTGDDVSLIVASQRLHGLAHWKEIFTSPYWPPPFVPDLYRPVSSLLLALQYALGFGTPIAFRLFTIALYAVVCVTLLRLSRRLLAPLIALAVTLLFAAHPVHVEALALAVAQSELVVALLACVSVAYYIDKRQQSPAALSWRDWCLLGALYLIASLSKEQGLVLPGLLIAAECTVIDRGSITAKVRTLWKGYAALIAAGVAVLITRTLVLGGALGTPTTADGLPILPLAFRALTMLQIVPQWFRLLLWPAHLRSDYGAQEFVASTSFGSAEASGLVLLVASSVFAWHLRRWAPVVTFGVLWSAVTLFPVSNLLASSAILLAERTLFLPSVGAMIAIGGVMAMLVDRAATMSMPARRFVPIAAGLFVLLGFARSEQRMGVWQDATTLMVAGVTDAPRSWRLQQGYGEVLFEQNQTNESILAFHRAIDLAPEKWDTRNALAWRLRKLGHDSAAVIQLRQSLAENPGQMVPRLQLAPALLALGKYNEARVLLDSIINASDAPPMLLYLRHVADSAIAANAPAGSVRVDVDRR